MRELSPLFAARLHATQGIHAARDRGEPHPLLDDILGRALAWVDDSALCAQSDSETFFPEQGTNTGAEAKRLCRACPLLEPCRAYAMSNNVLGVWGATTYQERLEQRRRRVA